MKTDTTAKANGRGPVATLSTASGRVGLGMIIFFVGWLLLGQSAIGENWPMWRGPRGDGTSLETGVPLHWSSTENIAWKTALPGQGHSSPVLWEDRVLIATCLPASQHRQLLCLDRKTGATLWRKTVVQAPLEQRHALNSWASGTPATDGRQVYVTFLEPDGSHVPYRQQRSVMPGQMVVAAYDLDGRLQWKVRPGPFASIHGFCSSPVLFEDLVIVNGDHDGDAFIVALDRQTGKTRWKTARENKTRSYSTPIIRDIDGRTQMILSGNMCVVSYDPRDGSRHWIIDGPTEQFVASVVYNGTLLLVTAGFPEKHILAIRPDGKGNVTNSHIVWRTRRNCAYVPSPIVVGPYLLVAADNGIATCFLASTGRSLWVKRLGRHYSSSLVTAEGRVYFTSDDGVTQVVLPGESYQRVAENQIGETCVASLAISHGQIFLRGEQHLFCIGRGKEAL